MPKLVIIYGTSMRNTELVARAIEEGAIREGVETLLKNVNDASTNDILNADAVAIGSPNCRDAMMPTVKKFLKNLACIDLRGRVGLAFGSYGWGLEAIDDIHNILLSYGMEMVQDCGVKGKPEDEELDECRRVGSQIARKIKE
ncbi:MAG: FprA family A-type flavoprotein [Candidatus Methanoperedenaceae archaeon]|nr:FprA family A-type flavoprotein [Candidatus Methanoperedenaceae archaeon]MDW7727869.1 flavodoxin domain-containing protein [Candidatus Methanoperedens sp.]